MAIRTAPSCGSATSALRCQHAFLSPVSVKTLKRKNVSQITKNVHRRDVPVESNHSVPSASLVAAGVLPLLLWSVLPDAAQAIAVHTEPANALSLPTWGIHVSSVAEWVTAMALMWKYADLSGNPRWKGMAWGMLPSLGGAMAACTWHFFYNSPDLDFLVALQAFLTMVGNFTCWWAAYRIYVGAKAEA